MEIHLSNSKNLSLPTLDFVAGLAKELPSIIHQLFINVGAHQFMINYMEIMC